MGDATPGHDAPDPATKRPSGWAINWRGLAGLIVILAVGFVAWNWATGSDDDSTIQSDAAATNTSTPAEGTDAAGPATTTTTTTRPPTTTTLPATTTTVASERRVLIVGEMKPCRFGDNCLVASFTIEGFEGSPGRYTCIYPNSQSDFTFNSETGSDDACLTGDSGDTITIEVEGVRSATVSQDNLDGT